MILWRPYFIICPLLRLAYLRVDAAKGWCCIIVTVLLAWPSLLALFVFRDFFFEGEEFPVLRFNPGVQSISFLNLVRFSSLTVYRKNTSNRVTCADNEICFQSVQ